MLRPCSNASAPANNCHSTSTFVTPPRLGGPERRRQMLDDAVIVYAALACGAWRTVHAGLDLISDIETFGLQGSSWFEAHSWSQLPLPSSTCIQHWISFVDQLRLYAADVTGLSAVLARKAAVEHGHGSADQTGLRPRTVLWRAPRLPCNRAAAPSAAEQGLAECQVGSPVSAYDAQPGLHAPRAALIECLVPSM